MGPGRSMTRRILSIGHIGPAFKGLSAPGRPADREAGRAGCEKPSGLTVDRHREGGRPSTFSGRFADYRVRHRSYRKLLRQPAKGNPPRESGINGWAQTSDFHNMTNAYSGEIE